jgi:hypothetical protein
VGLCTARTWIKALTCNWEPRVGSTCLAHHSAPAHTVLSRDKRPRYSLLPGCLHVAAWSLPSALPSLRGRVAAGCAAWPAPQIDLLSRFRMLWLSRLSASLRPAWGCFEPATAPQTQRPCRPQQSVCLACCGAGRPLLPCKCCGRHPPDTSPDLSPSHCRHPVGLCSF